jgi:HD-like signal output (HDOD) protein
MVELFNTLDKLHGEFGAVLLKNWRFSNECVQIAMYHDNLEGPESVSKELQVVRFANLLVKSMGYDRVPQKEVDLEDVGVRLLRLNPTMIGEVKDQLNKCIESDKKSLFLGGSIGKSTL